MNRGRWVGAIALCSLAAACGGGPRTGAATAGAQARAAEPPRDADDRARCDFKGRSDREVVESSGPGSLQPNVRRVFGIIGEGEDRRRVLFCREVDTNLDSVKDVVRTYNDRGEAIDEHADSDYDGKFDTRIQFSGGRIAKVELDAGGDGRVDETRYYVKGKLSRVQRDSNHDGKPDVWEVYVDGVLDRLGTDLDFDGHVDRWDRDEIAHREAAEKERLEEERQDAARRAAEEAEKAAAPAPTDGAAKAAPAAK